ncbi:hypothetical protein FUA23_11480 [Neolewinella aurantiaca]|uniref:RHS repeat-associated core domain-containing protein n=1 Tax=Neolewinella aurantiaca TaxID=2602767 RepID=A0A5C7FNI5_9BACT|nr:hypothetical protein [Neolewinella aurantiaca]TXF89126.1 hypothetical protein FUA23_11480 [Neolewinella aurantiaca]
MREFLGVDPLASDYAAWSPYNYVEDNPIGKTDPDGRSSEDCCGGPTIADEIIPSLVAAGKQLTHSISRNAQIIFGGKKPEDIPYRTYSTEWDGERSVVVYSESSVEPSTASRVFDNTTSGLVLAGAVPSSGAVLSAKSGVAAAGIAEAAKRARVPAGETWAKLSDMVDGASVSGQRGGTFTTGNPNDYMRIVGGSQGTPPVGNASTGRPDFMILKPRPNPKKEALDGLIQLMGGNAFNPPGI